MNNGSRRNPFLSGVTALTLSTLVVKVIGLVYKIPMMHYLGAEGMGYFNSAYELYSLFFVIATAGLPVAVSILISENVARGRLRNVKKIYGASFAVFLAIGLAGALLLCLFSKQFAAAVGSPDASLAIATIAPTVFFVSVAAVVRGYFQGKQNMVPTAVSQVIEALSKLILGILLAAFAVKQGWPADKTAAVAVVGLVVGTAISMLYLLLSQALKRFREDGTLTDATTEPSPKILRRLFALAIPVTVSASLSSLTRVADMTLILRRMTDIGYDATVATAMFGSYSTLAVPIYHLPSSLIAGIAVSLVPTLTEAVESRDRLRADRLIADALRLCAFVAIPCSLGLSVFSRPIYRASLVLLGVIGIFLLLGYRYGRGFAGQSTDGRAHIFHGGRNCRQIDFSIYSHRHAVRRHDGGAHQHPALQPCGGGDELLLYRKARCISRQNIRTLYAPNTVRRRGNCRCCCCVFGGSTAFYREYFLPRRSCLLRGCLFCGGH